MSSTEIVIVGAGVLGLSTALAIKEHSLKSTNITVIAAHLPDDYIYNTEYTSPWAGAHFRPFPSKNEAEKFAYKITRITQDHFKKVAQTNPESSIKWVDGIEYFEAPDEYYQNISEGYSEDMEDFKVLDKKDLPNGVIMGTSYKTWVLNAPYYLQYLQRKLQFGYDVKFLKYRLDSLKQVNFYIPGNPIIINCSGKGLKYNGGYDEDCFPIRGQTLMINPPPENPYKNATITHQLKDGAWTFVIPRPLNGGYILGGTKQENSFFSGVKEDDTKGIIERGRVLFPELMKTDQNGKRYFDIVRINVGFRPARKGGLRIDLEKHENNVIINNYGAAGMGYELSYGSGMKVYELLSQYLSKSKL